MARKSSKNKLPKVSRLIKILHILKVVLSVRGLLPLLFIMAIASWAHTTGVFLKTYEYVTSKRSAIYKELGLVLSDILLEGQKYTDKEDILNAITANQSGDNLKIGMAIMDVDINSVRNNLERLTWVEYAVVERQLPSTLNVSIVEREPAALWQHDGQVSLIDKYGDIIDEKDLSGFKDLIILVGDDIPYSGENVISIINSSENLKKLVSSAIRVGHRRWNIRLHNDVEIKLPENNPEDAWKFLDKSNSETTILDSKIKSVDLRVSGKMFVQ